MNIFTNLTLRSAIVVASILAVSACSHEPKDLKEAADQLNDEKFDRKDRKDADCLADAYASNLFEIKVSENAALNAQNAEVKKLASYLVSGHASMNKHVKALADEKRVSLPTDLTDKQREKIENLAEKTGADYDKEYVKMMKEKHQHSIEMYEHDADKCVDTDIKQWANETLPEVRSHLDMTEKTWNEIKDLK